MSNRKIHRRHHHHHAYLYW